MVGLPDGRAFEGALSRKCNQTVMLGYDKRAERWDRRFDELPLHWSNRRLIRDSRLTPRRPCHRRLAFPREARRASA